MGTSFAYVAHMDRQNAAVAHGTEAASFCPGFNGWQFYRALALILDTILMVSIFAIVGVEGLVWAAGLLLTGVLLIMLARICRAEAPKKRLLTM